MYPCADLEGGDMHLTPPPPFSGKLKYPWDIHWKYFPDPCMCTWLIIFQDNCNVFLYFLSGIQQKNIVVTCNYVARKYGVTKLMYIKDAKEKCPQLVLVSGEDLTNYRNMSYKISGMNEKTSVYFIILSVHSPGFLTTSNPSWYMYMYITLSKDSTLSG